MTRKLDVPIKKRQHIGPQKFFVNAGFNVRPTELNAACGRVQLEKLESFNKCRNGVAGQFIDGLDELASLGRLKPMRITDETEPAWFGFPVLCEDRDQRDGLREHLETHDIEVRPVICGNMARQPALRHFPHRVVGTLAGADRVMDCGLYWGVHPLITDDEVAHVIKTVKGFFGT